jgi:hypothetical protein
VTAADNPYFARATANRLWGQFLGRGLAHPVDNLSDTNIPSHPDLLDALADGLVQSRFDLRAFIRELCNSRTYQLAATGGGSEGLPRWFERARVRPLSAEELADAWRVATGFEAAEQRAGKPGTDRFRPVGSGYMLRFFGQPTDGVGNFQGGLQEHLYLNNGPLSQFINCGPGGLLDQLSKETPPQRVERLFLSVLNRPPRPEEQARFDEYLAADTKPPERLQEAIWVLMTCSEFRFNH